MPNEPERHLAICINERLTGHSPSCGGRGSRALAGQLEQALLQQGIAMPLRHVDCLGRCAEGPNLRLAPGGHFTTLAGETEIPALLEWLKAQLD
jgi:NADH:ubiquinone oxidoreductase subunit E